MKLQTKINIRFLGVTFLVFSFAGVLFYFALDKVVDQNIREMLESRKAYILLNLQQNTPTSESIESPDHSIFIKRTEKMRQYTVFSDTLAFDQEEKELIPFRKMTFTVHSGGQFYEVILLQSLLESEDLLIVIVSFMVVLFVLVLLALFFLNRWLSNNAWKPFFKSLSVLNNWKIGESQVVSFDRTGISEFDQLNSTLENMMQKIRTDFVNLKEFTENASHEIQTPLAIIKSKLEMVLQDKTLDDQQHQRIRAAFESTIRLSKLNEALLLLSKIENRQFVKTSEIDICALVQSKLDYLEELFSLKQIEVTVRLDNQVVFRMNPLLADILINNLVSNALRHNIENGQFIISCANQELTISNTSQHGEMDGSRLFLRFAKQTTSNESNGLGLAIAYEICKNYHLDLNYSYSDGMHHMKISKKS
ncbi:sensor histidine kinase [Aquipluma nitroreducens]|uniref:histidine kinase n=1 Tax=Aquipluma nitroreducens TaxID=2010828 RepID=A0A5K7S9D4_9BACT|nr:histidine kinase dimerization/phospho-acceptor domain-containing protein [Aquipluma nitroreducens]BBE18188.1 sensor histidine kinase [Aquipluma nitroreducens]